MTERIRFNGIDGVTGSDPFFNVLSVGVKDDRGYPVQNDRFHIVVPHEVDGRRIYDPAFEKFNNAKPEQRMAMKGVLVHSTMKECYNWYRMAMVSFKNKMHKDRRPFCQGDGTSALRWMENEGQHVFKKIACPNFNCEYHLSDPQLCKPFIRYYFRLVWSKGSPFEGLPTPIVKYVSRSWHTTSNFYGSEKEESKIIRKGFLGLVLNIANQFQMEDQLFALPFTMKIVPRKKRSKGLVFPTVHIIPDIDLPTFFLARRREFAELKVPVARISALSPSENTEDAIAEDWRSVSVVPIEKISVPSGYAEPEPAKQEKIDAQETETKKKYVPMNLGELGQLADLQEIPSEKLPNLIYDTCVHHSKLHNGMIIDSYESLFSTEDAEGNVIFPPKWEAAKKSVETLKKFSEKAKMTIKHLLAASAETETARILSNERPQKQLEL